MWPWFVAAGVVVGLLVAAWFVAEAVAKDLVTKAVTQQVRSQFDIPAAQAVDVEIDGPLLLQLLIGDFGKVHISAQDVTIRGLTGDVDVTLQDVDIRNGFMMSGGDATVALDQDQLRQLLRTVNGFPADSLGLAAPDVTMTFPVSLFGTQLPVGVALTPGADSGNLVLTPASLQIGGTQLSVDDLRSRFGSVANGAVRDWTVCIKNDLPAGIQLQDAQVDGDRLVATFSISGDIAANPAMQQPGTCP
ncbi:DUF2993 domain-containing protein [Microbacterium sp. X-17]|uniref:LmeA family phospholipid-binding protein n=1 Tax=Microbacterium sp. X-17 TaxID=3144404 RepID=UPI0031F529A1